jgi:glycerophosphoryl diester phosphodiesterase
MLGLYASLSRLLVASGRSRIAVFAASAGSAAARACTSMGPRAVAAARAAALCGGMPREGADCVQVPLRSGRIPIVTAGFVRAAHRAGLPVHVWTVNGGSTMHDLLDLGVDGIMTDRPRLLLSRWTMPESAARGIDCGNP